MWLRLQKINGTFLHRYQRDSIDVTSGYINRLSQHTYIAASLSPNLTNMVFLTAFCKDRHSSVVTGKTTRRSMVGSKKGQTSEIVQLLKTTHLKVYLNSRENRGIKQQVGLGTFVFAIVVQGGDG